MSSFYAISDDRSAEDLPIVALAGEVDFAASPALKERLFDHIDAGRERLILDLTAVTFIDSTAIGVLIGAATRLRSRGAGTLAVVCPERRRSMDGALPGGGASMVRQVFEVTGLDAGIALCSSREEAVAELASVS
jgi:anti-sigma B factor antagonist